MGSPGLERSDPGLECDVWWEEGECGALLLKGTWGLLDRSMAWGPTGEHGKSFVWGSESTQVPAPQKWYSRLENESLAILNDSFLSHLLLWYLWQNMLFLFDLRIKYHLFHDDNKCLTFTVTQSQNSYLQSCVLLLWSSTKLQIHNVTHHKTLIFDEWICIFVQWLLPTFSAFAVPFQVYTSTSTHVLELSTTGSSFWFVYVAFTYGSMLSA